MRIVDVEKKHFPIPCESCYRVANYRVSAVLYGKEIYIYVCKKHIKKESVMEALERFSRRTMSMNKPFLHGIYENIKFKSYFEENIGFLHLLDNRGKKNYRKIENGLIDLVPYLKRYYKIRDNAPIRILVYRSNGKIYLYKNTIGYGMLREVNDKNIFIHEEFRKDQILLYSNPS